MITQDDKRPLYGVVKKTDEQKKKRVSRRNDAV